jgi:hypothetical protein
MKEYRNRFHSIKQKDAETEEDLGKDVKVEVGSCLFGYTVK